MARVITLNASEVSFDFGVSDDGELAALIIQDGETTLRIIGFVEQIDNLGRDLKCLAMKARNLSGASDTTVIGDSIGAVRLLKRAS